MNDIKLEEHLSKLEVSEIKDFRLLPVKEVVSFTDKALEIVPLQGARQYIAKSIMRVNSKGEIWIKEWKFKQMYGDEA